MNVMGHDRDINGIGIGPDRGAAGLRDVSTGPDATADGAFWDPTVPSGIGRVTSVKLVEIRVRREVAIGQAARGGIWMGSAVSMAASLAMPSTCM
jgi:hypothetical protein